MRALVQGWSKVRPARVWVVAMLLVLLAVALTPLGARGATFFVTQEWPVVGNTSGPSSTQAADGASEGLREVDTFPDPVSYPANQTITSGSVVSGGFPGSINASDNSYLQLQEAGSPVSQTQSRNPTALGSCNFASGGNGMVSDNLYATSSSNGANCAFTSFGFSLGAVTITGVRVGYEAFTSLGGNDQYTIQVSWDGGATFPCSAGPLPLQAGADPNTYSYANFTACKAWTPTDINNIVTKFIHVRQGAIDANRLDANIVEVTYLLTTNYVLNVRYDWTAVPAGQNHQLSVEAHVGDENLVLEVLTPPSTWTPRLTFSSVADQVLTYSFSAAEYNAGSPAIRLRDGGADPAASQYWVDEVKITTTVLTYAMDVRQNVTGITGINPVLQLKGNISFGGENFNVFLWNFTSGAWDLALASPFTSSSVYHNRTVGQGQISGGLVRLRYIDTNPTSTVPGFFSLDLVQISTVPGNSPPGLTYGGASPAQGNLSTVFAFFVRYTDVENDAPNIVYLNVDGVLYPMSDNVSSDTTYTDGKDYYYNLALSRATHNYSFQANASSGDRTLVVTGVRTVQVVNRPPAITSAVASLTVHTGTLLRRTFTGSDPDGDALTWSLGTNATFLNLGSSNGTLWGGAPGLPASYWVYINATDGWGGSASDPFILYVTNGAPSITNGIASDVAYRGMAYSRTFTGADPDGDSLTWTMVTNASFLSIGATNGTVWGRAPAALGSSWVRVSVADGHGGTATDNYTLAILNRPPVITNPIATQAFHPALYSRTFAATDPEGDPLMWSMVTSASWLSLGPSNGTLWGKRPLTNATYYVNVTVADPYGGEAYDNYTLTTVNSQPVLTNPGAVVIHPGFRFSQILGGVDPDGDTLRWSMASNATFAALGSLNGTLYGVAPGALGTFYVNATAVDGLGGFQSSNFSLVVGNRPPTITTPLGDQVLFRLPYQRLVSAADPDGDFLQWTMATNASFLSIDGATGTVIGATGPPTGTYSVALEVRDPYGGRASASYTLTLLNRPPTFTSTPATSWTSGLTYVQHPQGDDPDGDALTWGLQSNASWLTINATTGELRGSAAPGTYSVRLTLRDAYGATAYLNYTLTVQATGTTNNLDLNPLVVGGIAGAVVMAVALLFLLLVRRRPKGEIILKAILYSDRGIVLEELVSDQAPEPPIKFRDIVKALGEKNLLGTHALTIGRYKVIVIQDQKVHLAVISKVRSSRVVIPEARKLLDTLLAKEPSDDSPVFN